MLTHCCFFVLFFLNCTYTPQSLMFLSLYMHKQAHLTTHTLAQMHALKPAAASAPRPFMVSTSLQTLTHCCSYFYFTSQHSTISVCPFFAFSAAVHPKYQKAKEHSDSHKGDGRRGGEELPVVEAEIPHDSKNHHKDRHHQAAGAYGYTCRPESTGDSGPSSCSCSGLSPLLWTGIMQGLRDVAVDHAVVCDV